MSGKKRVEFEATKVVKTEHAASVDEENESPRSNPDKLEYSAENLLWPGLELLLSNHAQDVLESLRGFDFGRILTSQERKILTAIVIENKKPAEIGDAIGLSKQRVSQLVKSIGMKIRGYLSEARGVDSGS